MEESVIFGNKEDFAIELGFTKTKGKCKLGFWLKNTRLGNFKKAGELIDSVKEYHKFADNRAGYYLSLFDTFSAAEIFHYLVGIFFTDDKETVSSEDSDTRMEFYLFFGDQFSNQTGGYLLLYKYPNVIFIIKRPMDGPIDSYEIRFETFCKIFDEYIGYALRNDLV